MPDGLPIGTGLVQLPLAGLPAIYSGWTIHLMNGAGLPIDYGAHGALPCPIRWHAGGAMI